MSRIPTVWTFSFSCRIGRFGMLSAACDARAVIRRSASAYGRSASIRCSAFRSRAAEIISMARVIFRMFFTEEMRPRMSFRLAI